MGKYVLKVEDGATETMPYVSIENGRFSFSYDFLSSNLPSGTYEIDEDILVLKTDDGKNQYKFEMDGDQIIFQEEGSASVALTDIEIGFEVKDQSVFKLE